MYTLADLKSQDNHIRVCKAFIENQKRIIAERTAVGSPTTKDEHWLTVFQNGLVKHRMRRAEIVADLISRDDAVAPPVETEQAARRHDAQGIQKTGGAVMAAA